METKRHYCSLSEYRRHRCHQLTHTLQILYAELYIDYRFFTLNYTFYFNNIVIITLT